MRKTFLVGGALGLTALALASHAARAGGPLPGMAARVDSPGRAVASEDSAEALVLNPANLAFLPAPELRWTGVFCPDQAVMVGCGHALEAATPLPFGLATGL